VNHKGRGLNYAVTAIDRYGNESTPVSTTKVEKGHKMINFRDLIMRKPGKRNKRP
jgi:hypothetical protein